MSKSILPKNLVFGLGIIRHTGWGGRNMLFFCFDNKLRKVHLDKSLKKSHPEIAIRENKLVLIDVLTNTIKRYYSLNDIMSLAKAGYLNDIPKLLEEKEKLKKKMFDKRVIDCSSKTSFNILEVYTRVLNEKKKAESKKTGLKKLVDFGKRLIGK